MALGEENKEEAGYIITGKGELSLGEAIIRKAVLGTILIRWYFCTFPIEQVMFLI